MDVTACPHPGCELPAEILDRTVLESTDAPIEHARLVCLGGHRFFMPIFLMPIPALPDRAARRSAYG